MANVTVRINPSDETIRIGPLKVRFLVRSEDSGGSVAVFELSVPGKAPRPAPAHSHDHYEEYFREIAAALNAGGAVPDKAKLAEIMRRHGLTPVAPAP